MMPSEVQPEQVVRVKSLSPVSGLLANAEHLNARRIGAIGKVLSVEKDYETPVALVWVKHGHKVAPYRDYELTLVGVPCDDYDDDELPT